LELSLYHQAIVHLLGGEEKVVQMLPVHRDGISLGSQRFHLMDPESAFRLTAFPEEVPAYEAQIRRLLRLTALRAIHWINITHRQVRFVTVT
jgi:hypothetical protein